MTDSAAGDAAVRRRADRLLLKAALRGGPWVWLTAAAALLSAAAETVLPTVLGRTVDAVLGAGEPGRWLGVSVVVVALLVGCETVGDLAEGTSVAQATAWLRHTLVRHVLRLGAPAGRRFTAGDLTSRVVSNATEAGRGPAAGVWTVASLVPLVGSLAAVALIDVWLAVTLLAGVPVVTVLLRAFVRDTSDVVAAYQEVQGLISARLVDALSGARTIAAAGTVDQEVARVLGPLPRLHEHGQGMWRAQTRILTQDALFTPLLVVAVLSVAGFELSAGRITAGEMLAASQYTLLGTGLGGPAMLLGQVSRARAGARRAVEVLAEPAVAYGALRLPAGPGRLEFRDVTVRGVLQGLDLVVPGGAAVAVVGRSGAGKSVLAALAGRLTDPDDGEVLLDGVPLRHLERDALRRAVGYAFERPTLIGHTVGDAIAFGPRPNGVPGAARAACADAFIRRLPRGYDTPLADAPMSGGEVQRIGLARAFAHPGRVLVLDDATSSLDTVTELQVSHALTGDLRDRTRLIVAHRAATAARADLVAWLDGGRVRALAPHRRLWDDPAYRAVFNVHPSPNGKGHT